MTSFISHLKINLEKTKFGTNLATFRVRGIGWRDWWFFFLPASLAVIILASYGVWRTIDALRNYGPAPALTWSQPWYLLATLLLLSIGIFAAYRIQRSYHQIKLYEFGLRIRFSPFSQKAYRWEHLGGIASAQIEEQLLGKPMRVVTQAYLYPNVGQPLSLDTQLSDLPRLILMIKEYLYPHLWPALCEDFQLGRWVYFGCLAVQKQTLRLEHRNLAWEDVSRVWVDKGHVVIDLKNQSHIRCAVIRVPNLELFLRLIDWGINA